MVVIAYFVVIAIAFFFLIVRPQRQRMAAHRALVAAVAVGDEVVTTGGIFGTVRSIGDDVIGLEISPAVVVTVARGAIGRRIVDESAPDPSTDPSTGQANGDD